LLRNCARLLCVCVLLLSMPVQVWAGGVLDADGDGVHMDDIVKYVNANGGKINKAELLQLTGQISPLVNEQSRFGTVRGSVVDTGGAPVSGARVIVEGTGSWADTSAQGTFEIADVPVAADVRLHVSKSGYADAFSNRFNVWTGETAQIYGLQIAHLAGTLTGIVLNPADEPVGGASVQVTGHAAAQQVYTGSDGAFRIDDVYAGAQSVTAWSAVYGIGSQQVQIAANQTTNVTIRLAGSTVPFTGSVAGTVFESGGGPIANAQVALSTVSGATYSAFTAATGGYMIADVPLGSYSMSVSASGFITSSGTAATLTAPGPLVMPPVFLTSITAAEGMSGKVLGASGTPLPNATVTLMEYESAAPVQTAVTGADGSYVFPAIDPHKFYLVSASADGFAPSAWYGSTAGTGVNSYTMPDIQMLLPGETGEVSGIVYDGDAANGQRLAGAKVSLSYMLTNSTAMFRTETDANGQYSLPYVKGGQPFSLYAYRQGYGSAYLTDSIVTAGGTLTGNLSLYPQPVVTSIATAGADITVYFSTPIYDWGGNPWEGRIDIQGANIKYATTSSSSISADKRELTLRFDRNLQSGDRLVFVRDVRSDHEVYMEPVVYSYDGTAWSKVINLPNDAVIAIDPIDPITSPGNLNFRGTANDPQGMIYVGKVKISMKNEATGKYYMPGSGADPFISDSEVFLNQAVQFSGNEAYWTYFMPYLNNGTYTMHAVVDNGHPVDGSAALTFEVSIQPYISYADERGWANEENALQAVTYTGGTLYLIDEDIPVETAAQLEAAVLTQPSRALKKPSIVPYIPVSMSTAGLTAGRYALYLADGQLLSDPKPVELADKPTASYQLNPWFGLTLAAGYYNIQESFAVSSDFPGKAFVVPSSVPRSGLKAFIESSQASAYMVQDILYAGGTVNFTLAGNLPEGDYRIYSVYMDGASWRVSEPAVKYGVTDIHFRNEQTASLAAIQYMIKYDMLADYIQLSMLTSAGLQNLNAGLVGAYAQNLQSAKTALSAITDMNELSTQIQSIINSSNGV
jgi:hypothetical protein